MRSRTPFFALLFVVGSLALPFAAHAAIPFFGPIIPQTNYTMSNGIVINQNACAAGWGMVVVVINNIISFLITIAIVFVAPIMIAYSGFLMVVGQGNAGEIGKAKGILTNTIVGIIIALTAWMIVDAIMAALYNANAGVPGTTTTLGTWSNLITGQGDICIPIAASLNQAAARPVGSGLSVIPTACSALAQLTPITDPLSLQMENGQTVIWDNTDPQLQPCVNKFIGTAGGTVTSAYRPQAYQTHLYEIKDRWCIQGLKINSDPACTALKSTISDEVTKHFGSAWDCGAVAQNSTHSSGIGVDIAGVNPSDPAVQAAAANACLQWKNYPGDPYHYDLISSCTCQ